MIFFNKKNLERQQLSVLIEHFGIMAVSAAIIFASFYFSPEDLEEKKGLAKIIPECFFKQLTGTPCPSCGMSRAFSSISRRNFYSAYRYNPLSFIIYPLILSGIILPPLSLLHYYYLKNKTKSEKNKEKI